MQRNDEMHILNLHYIIEAANTEIRKRRARD